MQVRQTMFRHLLNLILKAKRKCGPMGMTTSSNVGMHTSGVSTPVSNKPKTKTRRKQKTLSTETTRNQKTWSWSDSAATSQRPGKSLSNWTHKSILDDIPIIYW